MEPIPTSRHAGIVTRYAISLASSVLIAACATVHDAADVAVEACIQRNGSDISILWTVRNSGLVAYRLWSETLPWGPAPYGASFELLTSSRPQLPVQPVMPMGSSRQLVELAAGGELFGRTALTPRFPNHVEELSDKASRIRWQYEFLPKAMVAGRTFQGELSWATSICPS